MKKITKSDLNAMIGNEVNNIIARKVWEESKPAIRYHRQKMISEGHSKQVVNEWLTSALSGIGTRLGGLGLADFVPAGGSEAILGGDMADGIRVAIEQTILEKLVTVVGLDPYSGFGLTLKNTFEQVLRKYSTGELKKMMVSDGDCRDISFKIAREVLEIIEESEKERVLSVAIRAVTGEMGAKFQTSALTKGIYQNMRERFSEASDDIFDEEAMAKELADMLCDNFKIENILNTAKDYVGTAVGDTFSEFAGAMNDLKDSYAE